MSDVCDFFSSLMTFISLCCRKGDNRSCTTSTSNLSCPRVANAHLVSCHLCAHCIKGISISANIISAIAYVLACVSMSQMLVTCVPLQAKKGSCSTQRWFDSIHGLVHKRPPRSSSLEAVRRHMHIDVDPCVIILHCIIVFL